MEFTLHTVHKPFAAFLTWVLLGSTAWTVALNLAGTVKDQEFSNNMRGLLKVKLEIRRGFADSLTLVCPPCLTNR